MTPVPLTPGACLLLVDLDGPLVRLLPHPAYLELTERVREAVREQGEDVWPELAALSDHVAALREIDRRRPGLLKVCAAAAGAAELDAAGRETAYPEAVAFVRNHLAVGCSVAVVTNNDADAARLVLERAGLGGQLRGEAGLGEGTGRLTVHGRRGDVVATLKPEPHLLLEALTEHDTAPDDALMLGDMPSDVQAAQAAGVRAIGVTDSPQRAQELRDAGAVDVVARLADLALDAGSGGAVASGAAAAPGHDGSARAGTLPEADRPPGPISATVPGGGTPEGHSQRQDGAAGHPPPGTDGHHAAPAVAAGAPRLGPAVHATTDLLTASANGLPATAAPRHPDGELPRPSVERVVETVLPTRHGRFRMLGYRDHTGTAHVALVLGLQHGLPADVAPLVRIHSECLTGDAFGSRRCDCGEQLDAALARVSAEGSGAVIYVRGHEGRGIGILDKLRAYRLQDGGVDTVDANLALGHQADLRTYDQSALILADLGVPRIRLMSSNPAKEAALSSLGVTVVSRTRLPVPDRPENQGYLATKRERMGHDVLSDADVWAQLRAGHAPAFGEAVDPLVDVYGPLVEAGSPLTIAQLGQSLDGFIAARSGDAEFVTGPEDRTHLHRLRALVDAVVVGCGTVCADDPQLTVRAVPGENPVRVVLDPGGRVPLSSHVLTDGAAPTLWVIGPSAQVPDPPIGDHVEVVRLPADGDVDPEKIRSLLRDRGLGRVLVEGGGRIVSSFLVARLIDRLYLTTAPVLIGDGVPGIRFAGSDSLADALRGTTSRRIMLGSDVCTELVLGAAPAEPSR